MLIVYLRSSSYKEEDSCPHSYFLRYVLDIPAPANKAAAKGTIVHKALELLGLCNKAKKEGKESIHDDLLGKVEVAKCNPQFCIGAAFDGINKDKALKDSDLDDCIEWMWMVLSDNNGMFDPRQLNIKDCEVQFDIEITEPWAYYKYHVKNVVLEGNLKLKGTIDLIIDHGDGVIELLDWKTGRRWDWDKNKEKTYEDLKNDPQLHLYYYAARKLYPEAKTIIVTIHFIKDGGPFSIHFDDDTVKRAEQLIKNKFETIKNTVKPKQVFTWKCSRLCHFGKTTQPGTNITICDHFAKELQLKGMNKVVDENLKSLEHLIKYGEGGGRGK